MNMDRIVLPHKCRFKRNYIEYQKKNQSLPNPLDVTLVTTRHIPSPPELSPITPCSEKQNSLPPTISKEFVTMVSTKQLATNETDITNELEASSASPGDLPSPISCPSPVKKRALEDEVECMDHKRTKLQSMPIITSNAMKNYHASPICPKKRSLSDTQDDSRDDYRLKRMKGTDEFSIPYDYKAPSSSRDQSPHVSIPQAPVHPLTSGSCPHESKRRAIELIEWAIVNSPVFSVYYIPTEVLGWG
ncbi:hypothetical protein HDV02_003865, partial [Globomyces sp. JEL0801]